VRVGLRFAGLLVLLGWVTWSANVRAQGVDSVARFGGIVLGSKSYFAPRARGWGTVKPRTIFNGGDPAGLVSDIRWQRWGQKSAFGWGKTSIFKPNGGYYPRLVRAELRATDIGRCFGRGPLAYMRLYARVPARPGGPLGKWFPWTGTGNICKAP
jgi:hypothetical protein